MKHPAVLLIFIAVVLSACGPKAADGPKSPEPAPSAASAPAPGGQGAAANIVGSEISYEVAGHTMNGFLAYDANIQGPRPGILVVHEWWGHNDYARKRARMLAELGYTALAVDMYGDGKLANHPDDAGKFATAVMQNLDMAKMRFTKAMELLKEHSSTDPERIAAIGYCFGGGMVLHMARFGVDLDGVVSFHGNLATQSPAQAGAVKAKILVCHGADDPLVPPEHVTAFKQEMDAAGAEYNFQSYAGATHGFTNPEADQRAAEFNLPLAYNADIDAQSWAEMQRFFEQIFAQ